MAVKEKANAADAIFDAQNVRHQTVKDVGPFSGCCVNV